MSTDDKRDSNDSDRKDERYCMMCRRKASDVGPLITVAALRGTENKMAVDAAMDVRELVRIIDKTKNALTAYKSAKMLREYFADMPSVVEVLDRDIENAVSFIRNVYNRTPEEYEVHRWRSRKKT